MRPFPDWLPHVLSHHSIRTQPAGCCAKFRWLLLLRSICLTRPVVVATLIIALRIPQMPYLSRLETSLFSRPGLLFINHTTTTCPCHSTVHVCAYPASDAAAITLLIFLGAHLDKRPSRVSPRPSPTPLQDPPIVPIMSDSRLIARRASELASIKETFLQERGHLQQDEIKLQWAAYVAPLTSILWGPEAPARSPEHISTQGQMARQSTSESWAKVSRNTPVNTHAYMPLSLWRVDARVGYHHPSPTLPPLR